MKTIRVKEVVLDEGRPKICVPIVAHTADEAVVQAKAIQAQRAYVDLVEWRADWLDFDGSWDACFPAAKAIAEQLTGLPLLFTFRTAKEGGAREPAQEVYLSLTEKAVRSGLFDLVDIELSAGAENVKPLLETAHERGVFAVCSSHDFCCTPSKEELLARMAQMDALGADILKIAVMPQAPEDVLRLLEVTQEISRRTEKPLITMAMSELGLISRLGGGVFGSCITFGTVGAASAPGQISAVKLREMLDLLYT